jgi:hypothetical protein
VVSRPRPVARLLPEQSLRCGRPVRTRAQEVVAGCKTCPFPGMVKSSQLVVAQREGPIAPCHLGAGALAHLRELGRLSLQLVVLNRTQRRPPTGRKPWCLEARGKRTQRLARCPCPARGHTRKVIRGNPGSFSFLVQCRSAAALTLAGLPIGGRPLRGACRPPPGEAPWPYTAAWSGSAGCAHTARGIDPPHRGHRGPHATAARCPRGPARGCAHGLRWRARAPGWSPQRPPRLAPPPSWA